MQENRLPEGLWPVMLTPFNDNGTLDLKGLQTLTDFYIHSGADGLFANCLSSEMFQLSDDERLTVIREIVAMAESKIPVIATGTFGHEGSKTYDYIKKIHDLGVAAVVINTNQLTDKHEGEEVFKKRLGALIEATPGVPLGLYECPVPYKRLLSPSLMHWIAETGRFLYHKDTSCDQGVIEHKLVAIQNSSLGLYNAHVPTGLKTLVKGAAGLSPIGANYYPELFSFLIRNFRNGQKAADVLKVNQFLTNIDPFIHQNYPLSAKRFLRMRGIGIGEATRTVVNEPSEADNIKLKNLLAEFEQLSEEIGQPLVRVQNV